MSVCGCIVLAALSLPLSAPAPVFEQRAVSDLRPGSSIDSADSSLTVASLPRQASVGRGVLPHGDKLTRTGLLGWGLGIELPMVGIVGGLTSSRRGRFGVGYSLGGAISWEALPTLLIRAYVAGVETSGGSAALSFNESNTRSRGLPKADWLSIESGLGAAYLFRSVERSWTPYVGGDLGLIFGGYEYHLDDELAQLKNPDDPTTRLDDDEHVGLATGYTADIRGGLRLELVEWLSTMLDVGVFYARIPPNGITNTLVAKDVRSVSEHVWMFRTTFSARFGL
ncbi:MAG: hypothetical protein R3C68_05985 [Myxococcota bacterium]